MQDLKATLQLQIALLNIQLKIIDHLGLWSDQGDESERVLSAIKSRSRYNPFALFPQVALTLTKVYNKCVFVVCTEFNDNSFCWLHNLRFIGNGCDNDTAQNCTNINYKWRVVQMFKD